MKSIYKKKLDGTIVKRTPKELSKLKKKKNKVRQLERKRFSILTDDLNSCFFCLALNPQLHEVFFGSKHRQLSMKHGCVVPLCDKCHRQVHSDREYDLALKRLTQQKFEELYSRDEFFNIFGRSYL